MPARLELEGLTTHIRIHRGELVAVDRLSLTVEEGETLGMVGESGCGKTITALSIMGLLPPGGHVAGGRILYQGQDLANLPERHMRRLRGQEIAMVFQDPAQALNPTMAIGEQVAEGVTAHQRVSHREAMGLALDALGEAGAEDPRSVSRLYPHQLSGGLRQRTLIAMAIVGRPKLLLADEPTTAVDLVVARQIMSTLQELRERLALSVLLFSHDRQLVETWADRTLEMRAGRLVDPDRARSSEDEDRQPAPLPPSAWGLR
ncbi:MAG: ABC transporter ATP-binding protein [Candidatus Dormibacteria bacterium]|jgi:ABC-type glutathione transport system ATPase component